MMVTDFAKRVVMALEAQGGMIFQEFKDKKDDEIIHNFIVLENKVKDICVAKIDLEDFNIILSFREDKNKIDHVVMNVMISENINPAKCPFADYSFHWDEKLQNIFNEFFVFITKRIVELQSIIKKNKNTLKVLNKFISDNIDNTIEEEE